MNRLCEPKSRVLAFGAHPDDLEVGAGGLLARLVEDGADVTMAVTAIPYDLDRRRAEAMAAARVIGAGLRFVFDDGPCRVEDLKMHDLVRRFDQLVGDLQPSLVITHCANDLHFDHGLVNRATVSALRRTACDVLAYVSSPEMNALVRGYGNCFADITTTIDTKIAAITAHTSQLTKLDVESSRDLARAMGRIGGYTYAEAFEVLARRTSDAGSRRRRQPHASGSRRMHGDVHRGCGDLGHPPSTRAPRSCAQCDGLARTLGVAAPRC